MVIMGGTGYGLDRNWKEVAQFLEHIRSHDSLSERKTKNRYPIRLEASQSPKSIRENKIPPHAEAETTIQLLTADISCLSPTPYYLPSRRSIQLSSLYWSWLQSCPIKCELPRRIPQSKHRSLLSHRRWRWIHRNYLAELHIQHVKIRVLQC